MRLPTVVLLVLLLLAPAANLTAAEVRIDTLLSAPFPSDLVAAPTGGAIAWVFDHKGVRNLWVAEPPSYEPRQLTSFRDDDGQEILEPAWLPDARGLIFVRGGDPNGRGEFPNPALDPDGTSQAVWMIGLQSGEPAKLGEGSAPAVSPGGESVAFIRRGEIWTVGTDKGSEPKQLLKTRGRLGALSWSPDGSSLAFVSRRGAHSFVGVFQLQDRRISYLAPAVDRDGSPAWSPDGKSVAFIRQPARTRTPTFGPRREATPWSIWVVDPSGENARRVWKAGEGPGSAFRGVVSDRQLFWMADGSIIFPWERDGWTHLYRVSPGGGQAQILTPGDFEVEHVSLSFDGRDLFFSSNQDDINRRHLWRLSGASNRPERLTAGEGIEWSPVSTSASGRIAFLRSGARQPATPAVLDLGGAPRDVAHPDWGSFPSGDLVEPKPVIFPAADGLKIPAQLFLPGNIQPGERRPAVIFFHGGSRRQMLLGWHYMYYYHNSYAFNQYLVSKGYVVLSVNYRSGIGYGMEFREALNYGASGASEFNDVQGAGLYLAGRPDVDPGRIGLWGGSYGGYLTALGLARASDLFAAGVDLHGVHDWNLEWDELVDGYDSEAEERARKLAWESSPMSSVADWKSPVLMIHGDDDRNVVFDQTIQLTEDLRAGGVEVELLVFPDEVHDFLLHRNWLRAYWAAADFFDRKLGISSP